MKRTLLAFALGLMSLSALAAPETPPVPERPAGEARKPMSPEEFQRQRDIMVKSQEGRNLVAEQLVKCMKAAKAPVELNACFETAREENRKLGEQLRAAMGWPKEPQGRPVPPARDPEKADPKAPPAAK